MNKPALDPSHIMQVGMGFFGSRTLLTAVELELFTHLRAGRLTGEAIAQRLRLHPRAIPDFPDALVALGVLHCRTVVSKPPMCLVPNVAKSPWRTAGVSPLVVAATPFDSPVTGFHQW